MRSLNPTVVIDYLLICTLLNVYNFVNGIHITLEYNEGRCFTSNAHIDDKLIGSVTILPPEAHVTINLYKVKSNVTLPKDETPIPDIDFSNVNYDIPSTGFYTLCITNLESTPVTAIIATRIESYNNKGLSTISTVDDLKDLLKFADKLLNTTHSIMNRMEAYSTREYLYSKVIDKMNSRIFFWSIFQMVIVIGLCCFQIYYISSFFEVKSFV